MTTPIRRFEEYLERSKKYQQRADSRLAHGRFLSAGRACLEGFMYVRWAGTQKLGDLPGSSSHSRTELREGGDEFLIESTYCLTKAGHPKSARKLLDKVLTRNGNVPSCTKQQEIKAHFYKALTFVAERDDILAAAEFRITLGLQPNQSGADEQVNAMEAMLQMIPLAERCSVEAYLVDFMKSYRDGEPESTELSRDDSRR